MVARVIEFCARNRLLVLFGVAVATAAGVWSIGNAKLDAIPDLSEPQVIVATEWMGHSPTDVEDHVTYPLVAGLLATPKVAAVRGHSMFGMSLVYVIFDARTDVESGHGRVLEQLSGIRRRLPEGAEPTVGPAASATGWAFQYVLVDRSGRNGIDELRTFQDFTLRSALGAIPGVAEVASVGGYQKQYQVAVDPNRLRTYDVNLEDVIRAVRDSSNDAGGRVVEMSGREYYVRGRGSVQDLAALERVPVKAGPAGVPILVRDVGSVRSGPDIRRGLLEWNGEGEAVGGIVVLRPGENALEAIGRVKQKIEELRPGFPPGVEIEVAYDRAGLIERSIATLRRALIEEAAVIALVILLFLLHLRSSLLPVLSIPVAVAVSFVPMYLLGVPATIMSLGGIAIAIGAAVDAEIVMIEASHRKLERAPAGADRRRLLAEAAAEVTPAIFFSLLIVAVAFLPVFALGGQAGQFVKPLAYAKTFIVLAAAVLSITLAPALRDLLIRGAIRPESANPISRAILALYRPFVYVALRRPKSTLAIGLLAVLSAVPLALRLGHEFMPPLDEGDLLYMPTTLPGISIEEAKRALQHQDRVLRSFPEVISVFGKAGRADTATDPAPISMIETTARLRPAESWRQVQRRRWYSSWAPEWAKAVLRPVWPDHSRISWEELTAEMNRRMQFPGWTNAFTMPIRARVDMLTTGVRTPVGIKVLGGDLRGIETVGTALERLIAPIPGTRSVYYERNTGGLYLDVVPDRVSLARHGITVGQLERAIEAAVGGAPLGSTVERRGRFSISVRYPQDLRSDVEGLRRVLVAVGHADAASTPPGMERMSAQPRAASAGPSHMSGRAELPPPAQQPPYGNASAFDGPPARATRFVPLGQLAELRIVGGPAMVRDEDGMLAGYVYVDVDASRDVGRYVTEAKAAVRKGLETGELALPPGTFLRWTGQYELLEQLAERMRIIVPITLLVIGLLLYLQFRNATEVLIVLLSIPFALVGSVWLLWLLDYRLSTAVWVGILALVGVAAQTGVVMIFYIDQAYERRRRAGKIRDLTDIIWAHMEGTVMRVRPKLMTVATMLVGLVPLLWAAGSGADVMKRIAAPMVGGIITSAFLTLEIIPVVYTYWRQEQLLWERLLPLEPRLLARLRTLARVLAGGFIAAVAVLVSAIYLEWPPGALLCAIAPCGLAIVAAFAAYLRQRSPARRLVWPCRAPSANVENNQGLA